MAPLAPSARPADLWGLSFARPGSQPVPLPAGAVTKAREGRREGRELGARGCPRARCPGCSARPPAAAAPAASTARLGEEGGRRRERRRHGSETRHREEDRERDYV